ncbi:diguanylate cyclase, partial [bacterium M00.F.Ca.ET.229.01.1.1]
MFGRFSGDEFIVVLRDLAEPEDAGHVARKLIASLAEPLRRGETTLKVGASVGIAMLGDAQTDFDSLLRAADAVSAVKGGYSGTLAAAPARTNRHLYGDENPIPSPSFEAKAKLL